MDNQKKFLIENKIYIITHGIYLYNLLSNEDSLFYNKEITEKIGKNKTEIFKFDITEEFEKDIQKFEDFEIIDINAIREKELKEKKFSKLKDYRKNINKVKEIYKTKPIIASIDVEYKIQNNICQIFQIGYTILNTKTYKLIIKDFIVSENQKEKYIIPNKTFSIKKPLNEILEEIEKDFENISLIIGNNISADQKVLNLNGLKIADDKIFELSDMVQFISKQIQHTSSLRDISSLNGIFTKNLHNPSNDSFYTIKNFNKLIQKINNSSYSSLSKTINSVYGKEKETIKSNIKQDLKEHEPKNKILKEEYLNYEFISNDINQENFQYTEFYELNDIISTIATIKNDTRENIYEKIKEYQDKIKIIIFASYAIKYAGMDILYIDKNNMFYILKNIFNVKENEIDFLNILDNGAYPIKKNINMLNDLTNNSKITKTQLKIKGAMKP